MQLAAAAATNATAGSEVVVTAEKREENINNVGMSIQAASGEMTKLGINSTEDLVRVSRVSWRRLTITAPWSTRFAASASRTPRWTGSPTVSVYQDQMPLRLDPDRGLDANDLQPGRSAEGAARHPVRRERHRRCDNYIADKPTDTFEAGGDLTLGNFQVDSQLQASSAADR